MAIGWNDGDWTLRDVVASSDGACLYAPVLSSYIATNTRSGTASWAYGGKSGALAMSGVTFISDGWLSSVDISGLADTLTVGGILYRFLCVARFAVPQNDTSANITANGYFLKSDSPIPGFADFWGDIYIAIYVRIQFTVYFNANGGSVSPTYKSVIQGQAYGTLPTPTRTGYTFAGWYTAATGGTLVTSSTTVTAQTNHTLYAHWTASVTPTHTVYFDATGGTVSTASITVAEGSALGTLPTPTRSGYTFAGWFRSTIASDQVTAATLMGDEDFTVYAHWTPGTLTITFNANGGTVTEATRTVAVGGQYQRLPIPTWNGHNFNGWFTAESGGTQITAATTVTTTVNQTLYAHWTSGIVNWWSVIFS